MLIRVWETAVIWTMIVDGENTAATTHVAHHVGELQQLRDTASVMTTATALDHRLVVDRI